MNTYKSLIDFPLGSLLKIKRVHIYGPLKRRLLDLGFVPGAEVKVLQKSPLGDPIAYQINQTTIALRKEQGQKIEVTLMEEE